MISGSREIKITSLNTQGLKSNTEYISSLLETNDIVFLCEHWLSNAEKVIIDNLSVRHEAHFTPAEKGPNGRPYGGNCFLILQRNTRTVRSYMRILILWHSNVTVTMLV